MFNVARYANRPPERFRWTVCQRAGSHVTAGPRVTHKRHVVDEGLKENAVEMIMSNCWEACVSRCSSLAYSAEAEQTTLLGLHHGNIANTPLSLHRNLFIAR